MRCVTCWSSRPTELPCLSVSDERNPLELALDLLVFAPLGLLVSVTDELPKLVQKGRTRVESQVGMARMVGQLAAPQLQQQAERTAKSVIDRLMPPGPPPGLQPAPSPQEEVGAAVAVGAEPPSPPGTGGTTRSSSRSRPAQSAPSAQASAEEARGLAIPGYDSLSAMQVVQRLSGLSAEELEAVRSYESGHRGRKTIINRADQLLADAG
jgi:hypothetical protein